MDWDLLRTFEAIARLGSLNAAARALGVSQSTVSRQLLKLEEHAGATLLLRETPVRLTPRGESLLEAAQAMTRAALQASAALSQQDELRGEVTISTVAELVRWVLVPKLDELYRAHPQLQLKFLVSNQILSLAANEADLAIRMTRPVSGDLVSKRLRIITQGVFIHEALAVDEQTPWLGLAGSLAQLPEQRYAMTLFAGRPQRLAVEDVEALGLAAAQGLGMAVLPVDLAAKHPQLRAVTPRSVYEHAGPLPTREIWLVVHRAKQRLPQLRAVMSWLDASFA